MKQSKCYEIAQFVLPEKGEAVEIGLYANSEGETLFTMKEAGEIAQDLCKHTQVSQLVRYSNRYEEPHAPN